jgi:hypothetical protein
MFKSPYLIRLSFLVITPFLLVGCATTTAPSNLLGLAPVSLEHRQIQIREYDTNNEQQVLSACASLLQDMGFTLTEIDVKLGLLVGTKERDATNPGQMFLAALADGLAAAGGSSGSAMSYTDAAQSIGVSCVTKLNLEGNKVVVRVTFQRVILNQMGLVNRMENVIDPAVYEGFFEKLSKAVFLEANKI